MSQLADIVINGPLFFSAIPAEKAAALIYVPALGWLEWVEVAGTGAFKGYRSLRCGALEIGTTTAPRGYEADLVGGLGSKAAQASIWAWAQQQGHNVAAGAWTTKVFKFADVDADYFRFPDIRDMHIRFTGTNADNGAARALGTFQDDAMQDHDHWINGKNNLYSGFTGGTLGSAPNFNGLADNTQFTSKASARGAKTSTETRGANTAFAPRIHL